MVPPTSMKGVRHGQRLCARFAPNPLNLRRRAAEDAPPRRAHGLHFCHGKIQLGPPDTLRAERLEAELSDDGKPHVLQLVCEGDEREPCRGHSTPTASVRPRHRRGVRPCVLLRRRPTRSWAYAEKPSRRRPPLPQQATTTYAHRPQNSGGGKRNGGLRQRSRIGKHV